MKYIQSILNRVNEYHEGIATNKEIKRGKRAWEKIIAIPFPKNFKVDLDLDLCKGGWTLESLDCYPLYLRDCVYKRILGGMVDNVKRMKVAYRFTGSNKKLNHEYDGEISPRDVSDYIHNLIAVFQETMLKSAVKNGISVDDYVCGDSVKDDDILWLRRRKNFHFIDAYLATHFDEVRKQVKVFINGEEVKRATYAHVIFGEYTHILAKKIKKLAQTGKTIIEIRSGNSFVKLELIIGQDLS